MEQEWSSELVDWGTCGPLLLPCHHASVRISFLPSAVCCSLMCLLLSSPVQCVCTMSSAFCSLHQWQQASPKDRLVPLHSGGKQLFESLKDDSNSTGSSSHPGPDQLSEANSLVGVFSFCFVHPVSIPVLSSYTRIVCPVVGITFNTHMHTTEGARSHLLIKVVSPITFTDSSQRRGTHTFFFLCYVWIFFINTKIHFRYSHKCQVLLWTLWRLTCSSYKVHFSRPTHLSW